MYCSLISFHYFLQRCLRYLQRTKLEAELSNYMIRHVIILIRCNAGDGALGCAG